MSNYFENNISTVISRVLILSFIELSTWTCKHWMHATVEWFPRVISIIRSQREKRDAGRDDMEQLYMSITLRGARSAEVRDRKESYDALSRLNVGRFRLNLLIKRGSSWVINDLMYIFLLPLLFSPCFTFVARASHNFLENKSLDTIIWKIRCSLIIRKWITKVNKVSRNNGSLCLKICLLRDNTRD